ncbi:MAG: DMT family transporter [Leptolyngbya sp. SIO3F4]|nr:DMT family transporter [Leptolyngbya sp. SIO3F4]
MPVTSSPLMKASALICALTGLGCSPILLVMAEQEIGPYAATFDRLIIGTVIFLLWSGSQQILKAKSTGSTVSDVKALSRLDIVLLIVSGLAFAGSLILWAWSLTQTSVANATLLDNMVPLFTALGAWILFQETFSSQFLLGLGIAVLGVIIISTEDLQLAGGFIGDGAALGSAVLVAANILIVGQLRKRFDTSWIMLRTSLIGSVFTLIILGVLHESPFPHTLIGWITVILLAVAAQVLGQGLLTYCLEVFSVALVSTCLLSVPVISAVLAMAIFNEQLTWLNWFAFGIVLMGICLSILAPSQKEEFVAHTVASSPT